VSIQVNSETQITTSVTADANGMFELDLSELGKELEPGEHTVTYSYVDPNTGQSVEKTVVFFVAQSATAIVSQAQASTIVPTPTPTPTPFGSGNPYPATASATPTPTPTPATDSGTSTRSAMPSTQSGVPVSGSVGTTIALVFGGLFFIISGVWSFWISSQLKPARVRSDEF
jgi:hypothetical protein